MSQTQEKRDNSNERVENLQKDASRVLREISDLSAKLREVSREKMAEVSSETVDLLRKSLTDLEQRANSLNAESKKLLGTIDKSVKANPYLFIIGALGLGMLLGKWVRPQDHQ